MFYYQHLLYSLMAGAGLATIAYFSDKERRLGWKYLALFVLSIVAVNTLIDVDHYAGSVCDLMFCGMKTSVEDYKSDLACVNMHRGLFHQVRFGLFLVGMVLGWMTQDWKKILGVFTASVLILYSVTQSFYLEASMFYLMGLMTTGLLLKRRELWVGVMLLGFLLGWTQHMLLDDLIHYWFGQVM